jgi:hypothetical protein
LGWAALPVILTLDDNNIMSDHAVKVFSHYQEGSDTQVSCIFSCPGRHEKIAKHPAAKTTGTNLKSLFELLNQQLQNRYLRSRTCHYHQLMEQC